MGASQNELALQGKRANNLASPAEVVFRFEPPAGTDIRAHLLARKERTPSSPAASQTPDQTRASSS